jgi:hypothetical protein
VFLLVEHHKWSLTEVENLVPFERDIYITLIKKANSESNDNEHAAQTYEAMKKEKLERMKKDIGK